MPRSDRGAHVQESSAGFPSPNGRKTSIEGHRWCPVLRMPIAPGIVGSHNSHHPTDGMIKLDYQETWYEREERESFESPSPNGVKVPSMNAEQLFEQALAKVESESIRQWATSERNRPTWIKIAQLTVTNQNNPDVFRFSALIVSTAIGL